MATIVGSGSAAATSVTIPAHQAGDMILIFARGTAAAPVVPAAGGTVPAWTTLQSAIANSVGLTSAFFVATASTTTTGTWTSATHICVLVLRPGAGKILSTAAARSAVGNGNNTQTIVYPALTLQTTGGTSMGVRCGTRGVAVTAVGTAPTNWTNQVVQPAGASALMSVHTRAALTANPAADSVATSGTNSAYRAHTIEILEAGAGQNVSATGVGTAGDFGAVNTLEGSVSVQASGLYPPGYVPSITGAVISGDGHVVGGSTAAQFGVPTVGEVTGTNVAVGGVASAASFGIVTIRTAVRPAAGGVASAAAFGTPTIKATITCQVTGLGSAQSFGSPSFRLTKAVGGVASAQSFGTPTLTQTTPGNTVSVTGITSAQSFGTLTFKLTKTLGGVSSAQSFGTLTVKLWKVVPAVASAQAFGSVTIRASITRSVSGLPSAQSFGTITTRGGFTKPVGGVLSAASFGVPLVVPAQTVQVPGLLPVDCTSICGQVISGDGHLVGAIAGCQRFGFITVFTRQFWYAVGVPSAQQFGTLTIKTGPVWIPIGGCSSAQAFGKPLVYKVWIRPVPPCLDLSLDAATCTNLTLVASGVTEITLTTAACDPLTLTPAVSDDLDLVPVEVE